MYQKKHANHSKSTSDSSSNNQFAPRPFKVESTPSENLTSEQPQDTTETRQYKSHLPKVSIVTENPVQRSPVSPWSNLKIDPNYQADSYTSKISQSAVPSFPLQMKLHTEQLGDKSHQQPDSSADTIQPTELAIQSQEIQPENNTGLPDNLKTGVENLSGMGMDDVKVHYNSSEPPKFQAAAYTQGTDIHVAPGQEKHLPHEAWHVVQQKQGRVKPSIQLKGISANVDSTLEKEADVMGAKANSVGSVMSRLPSASQVKESIQSFGQTKPTTPPTKLGSSVRQFKCFGSRRNQASNNPQSEPEVVTSSKQEVDRTDQQFPPSEVDPKILAKSIEPKAAKIKSDIVGHLNLVPYDVATVTTWLNSMGEFPREEVPTVLYHPREETIMYHTTTTPAAQSILQTGLDPTYGGTGGAVGTSGEANAKGYIYLCNNETYACVVAKNFFGDTTKYNEGLTILQVIVDPSTVFVSDPDLASAVRTTRKLTNIKRYATVSNKGKIIAYSDEAIRPTEDVESDD